MRVGTERPRVLSPQERRARNREEVRAAILDAAREVMREEGVAGLNLQKVAARVGMRAPSLYEYFPGKMALYDALFLMGARLARERTDRLVRDYGATWEALRAALEDHFAFAREYPELFELVFLRPVPGFVPSEEGLAISFGALAAGQQLIGEAIEAGVIDSGLSPEQTLDLFIALMHGLVVMHLANEPHLPLGSGRFGSLLPAADALLRATWVPGGPRAADTARDATPPGHPPESEASEGDGPM